MARIAQRSKYASWCAMSGLLLGSLGSLAACGGDSAFPFDASHPARGPGQMVGNGGPVDTTPLTISTSADPTPDTTQRTSCDAGCDSYCSQLTNSGTLTNPVDIGLCRNMWGRGLDTRPIVREEACRRIFVDMLGHYPSRDEVNATCPEGRAWSDVATELLGRPEFVLVNQRLWADKLLYNNESVNVERIFDADELVGKLYRGVVSYDEFAAVASAHPVLTRRYTTPQDRAEALFNTFIGRAPYENERADMARLYTLWSNGYFDHPDLGDRVPDAFIQFACLDKQDQVDNNAKGDCTSVLWGYNELIFTPDLRAQDGQMWSGLLRPDEWQRLELPGRIVSHMLVFWEHAVDVVLQQYLGYDLAGPSPNVRQQLVDYVLKHNGDIRALHHAVATSLVYLQSSSNPVDPATITAAVKWDHGPLKQTMVEPWIDSIIKTTGWKMSNCDWRITQPDLLVKNGSLGSLGVLQSSRWTMTNDGVVTDYLDLAQTLGGCPDNQVGGRFTTVSILNTAVQENFVFGVCNPTMSKGGGASIGRLLPAGVDPGQPLDPTLASSILDHQVGLFLGRTPTDIEQTDVQTAASSCASCTAESFARPVCFALLSSAEQLFY